MLIGLMTNPLPIIVAGHNGFMQVAQSWCQQVKENLLAITPLKNRFFNISNYFFINLATL